MRLYFEPYAGRDVINAGAVTFQLGLNLLFSPLVALMPDRVPHRQKGVVAAYLGLAPPVGTISLQAPPPGTTITSPVTVTGRASTAPPSGALLASVYDRTGRLLGQQQVPSGGGDFTTRLPFAVSDQTPGRIEVSEYRTTDAYTLTTSGVVVTMTVPKSQGTP